MITLVELNKALCDKVRDALTAAGMEITLSPEDLSEPIRRPSIKVSIEDGSSGRENSRTKRTGITVRIYFFAANRDRPKMENLQVREALAAAFLDEVQVGSYWVPVLDDMEFTTTDGVLVATIELDFIERIPDQPEGEHESNENMESLHMVQRLEG